MRAVLAALLGAFAVGLVVIQALSIPATGEVPGVGVRALDASRRVVTSVTPNAAADGLRVGDVYDWSLATQEQRRARFLDHAAGEALMLPVVRDGKLAPVQLVARPRGMRDQLASYADILLKLLGMSVGILLIARGKGRFGLFSGIGLFGLAAGEGFNVSYAILRFPFEIIVDYLVLAVSFGLLRYCLVEAMIALCGDSLKRSEIWFFRVVGVISSLAVAAAATDQVVAGVAATSAHLDLRLMSWAHLLFRVELLGYAIALLRPATRDRELVAWVFWSSVVGFAGPTVNFLFLLTGRPVPEHGALNLTLFAMAFGFAYVALRYRVVDLSFVVNRAVVYGAILALVVGALSIAEALIPKLALGKADSLVIEMALAVVLGFSLKHIERRVDAVVERILFARKHAEEEGLRHLIRDCAHVEDADRLIMNVVEETRRLIGAEYVVIYERAVNVLMPVAASPANPSMMPLSIDDPVVVRMRSTLAPVDLGSLRSMLGTDGTVFPMLARGRVVGAIACGNKPGRRTYDPDERALLAELAHEAGTSLLFLRTESANVAGPPDDAIRALATQSP